MLRALLLSFAVLGLACSRSEPQRSAPSAPASAAAVPASNARELDRFIDEWLERTPSAGRALGLHQYDAKLADRSRAGIQAHIAWLRSARLRLDGLDTGGDADRELDKKLALRAVDLALFELVDRAQWQKNPLFYSELFAVNDYLDRDYAPIAVRAKKLVEHEEAALRQIAHVEANLSGPLSKPLVETAIKVVSGYAEYLRGDVVKLVSKALDPALEKRFEAANGALAQAAEKIAKTLKERELPRADRSHVLGPERYRRLLALQEGLDTPLAEIERMAEDDLAANARAYAELAKTTKVTRPAADRLFAEAQKHVTTSREFVIEKKLVTIPGDQKVTVKETPPYMRWNQAFLNAPGAFEADGTEALYYITLPDPSWSPKEQREYVLPTGVLVATTVHEVYPGHFLQGRWLRRAPTRAQKVFESYSFVEGWAHYVEQLMIEQGFLGATPEIRIGQLGDALLRNCRVVASIGIHTKGMSLEDAAKRFADDCRQDQATAREQAVRGTFDPGYFAYTLGKLQILKLRATAQKRLGARFSLQRFHDALLSHGSPPIGWIEKRVLAELDGPILNK